MALVAALEAPTAPSLHRLPLSRICAMLVRPTPWGVVD